LKLKLTVDGKSYEVDVEVFEPEPPQPGWVPPIGQARVPAAGAGAGAGASASAAPPVPAPSGAGTPVADESKVCRSPFAGVVSRVAVQVGQAIEVNDTLLVLEAMKMETVITAPIAGKVASVNAGVGDAVQQGQVLVVFE
jgi:methylmalonyl-CoA carboxyltransferase small subunit